MYSLDLLRFITKLVLLKILVCVILMWVLVLVYYLTNSTCQDLSEGHKSVCDKIQLRPPALRYPLDPCKKHIG